MDNKKFRATYNLLDSYIKGLIPFNVASGIKLLEEIVDADTKAKLKTIRNFKNNIISHNNLESEPPAPYEYYKLLIECKTLIKNNEEKVKRQLIDQAKKLKTKKSEASQSFGNNYHPDHHVYNGYPDPGKFADNGLRKQPIEKFYFRTYNYSKRNFALKQAIEYANLIAKLEDCPECIFNIRDVEPTFGRIEDFELNFENVVPHGTFGILMEAYGYFAIFNSTNLDCCSCIFGVREGYVSRVFGLYYMYGHLGAAYVTKVLMGRDVHLK